MAEDREGAGFLRLTASLIAGGRIAAWRTELLWLASVTAAVIAAAVCLPRSEWLHRRSPSREGEAEHVVRARLEEIRTDDCVCRTSAGEDIVCRPSRATVYGYDRGDPGPAGAPRFHVGDRVLVARHTDPESAGNGTEGRAFARRSGFGPRRRDIQRSGRRGTITTPARERTLLSLGWLFLVALGLAGGRQGMRAAGGLALSGLVFLAVFLPLAVRGISPALLAVPVCIVLASMNLLIVAGPTRKMLFALGGTAVGSMCAAVFAHCASVLLGLTGLEMEFGANFHLGARYWYAPALARVDFGGLLVAGMMIASLGAAMDVAMTVASATSEAESSAGGRGPPSEGPAGGRETSGAVRIGLRVGWAVVGVMVVTLAFVFFGAGLFSLLAMGGLGGPVWGLRLLSYEELAAEVARLAAAGLGMAASVPATAWLAARFGSRGAEEKACSAGA